MASTSPSNAPITRPVDAQALQRWRQRLQAAASAPWLHEEAARRLAERLAYLRQPPNKLLSWGVGPASVGVQWSSCLPHAQVWEWDDAAGEPPVAVPWWRRILGPTGVPRIGPGALDSADMSMVWSVMGLHWALDPAIQMGLWRRALAADGFLMFCTLGPGSLTELRELYAQAGWGVPHAPFTDMHDLGDMLVAAGFSGPVMDQETLTLTYASPQALMAELRSLGGNLALDRFAGCRTPRWRRALEQALSERADSQGRIHLSWEMVYGHAVRAPDRGPAVSADTRIGLSDMKLMLRKRQGGQ